MKNWRHLDTRTEIREYEEVETIIEKIFSGTRKISKLKYKYYICDNCMQRVIITDFNEYKANGSIIQYRKPNGTKVPIVVHKNRCFKEAIESINNFYK